MSKFSRRLDAVHALILGALERDAERGFSIRAEIANELRMLLSQPEYDGMREAGAKVIPSDDPGDSLEGLAHEIWSASQLAPGLEGVEDGVGRITEILQRNCVQKKTTSQANDVDLIDACCEIIDYPENWDLNIYPNPRSAIEHMLRRSMGMSAMLSKFDASAREVSAESKVGDKEFSNNSADRFDFGQSLESTLKRFEDLPEGSKEDYRRFQEFFRPGGSVAQDRLSPCCRKCEKEELYSAGGGPGVLSQLAGAQKKKSLEGLLLLPRFMVVCKTCGNKRCPKAADHNNACTGSNEPGQPGSDY